MSDERVEPVRGWSWALPGRPVDWDAVYAEQLPRVYSYFRYRVGTGAVAEDLTSATFEKAWRARHRYRRDRGAFTTWLFTVARHVAIDHYRQRRVHESLDAATDVAGGPTPEELAERRSDAERLARLVASLPERDRELLSLKYGAELTNRAIAAMTGLGESNVGTILHRAVRTLRERWSLPATNDDLRPAASPAGLGEEEARWTIGS